jgi:hypothetical protein
MEKVTMNLTEADIKNAQFVEEIVHARSKAQAIGTSLALAAELLKLLANGRSKLLVEKEDGTVSQIIIPGVISYQSASFNQQEWEADLTQLAESAHPLPALPDNAFNRHSIYSDHD